MSGELNEVVRDLTEAQKIARDAKAVTSGDPVKVETRAKNRIVGRALARVGFWRLLFGRWG